jgi:hypothetical protein
VFKSQAQFSFVNPFKDIATTPFKTHSVKSEPLGRRVAGLNWVTGPLALP